MTPMVEAREAVIRSALSVVLEERTPGAKSAVRTLRADSELYFAARNLVRAVDEADPAARPSGWLVSP